MKRFQLEVVEVIKGGIEDKSQDLLEIPEVNHGDILTSFYIDTGHQDVGSSITFFIILGGHSWNNIYYKNMEELNRIVMQECDEIIQVV